MTMKPLTRRQFTQTLAVAGTATALSQFRVLGANERVRLGFIGVGNRGDQVLDAFLKQSDAEVIAVCDIYPPYLDFAARKAGTNPKQFADYRRLLDLKDVDAVVISTPDHWHALQTIHACAAGKDVYVEKPLTLFVREGRWMLDVATRYRRVVQVGTQNRSGPNFQKARDFIRQGRLGEIVSVQSNFFRNVAPGFGNPPDQEPPPELDWDLMLGPAPWRRYNPSRGIYHFRWFWDYSGGQMTNLGQHSLDLVHWITGVKAPKAVYSTGGRFFLKDSGEVPDTQDAILEYPGFTAVCQYRECTAGRGGQGMGGLMFHGTRGTMAMSRAGFEVFGDPKVSPNNTVAKVLPGGHPVGGPQPEPEPAEKQHWTENVKDDTGDAMLDYVRHAQNFLDCIRSRQSPASDLESGHQIATTCHLANISLKVGRKVVWDADHEQIVGDPAANAMLVRPYRAPWDAELKALGVG